MDAVERAEFVSSYSKLLTSAWSDPEVLSRLQSDSRAVLAEYGLELPAGATAEIHTESGGESNLDQAIEIWEQGATTGTYVLYVPAEAKYDPDAELDERELEGVVGGGTSACCCCSSPCCSCT